jgi:hypothetical protein
MTSTVVITCMRHIDSMDSFASEFFDYRAAGKVKLYKPTCTLYLRYVRYAMRTGTGNGTCTGTVPYSIIFISFLVFTSFGLQNQKPLASEILDDDKVSFPKNSKTLNFLRSKIHLHVQL